MAISIIHTVAAACDKAVSFAFDFQSPTSRQLYTGTARKDCIQPRFDAANTEHTLASSLLINVLPCYGPLPTPTWSVSDGNAQLPLTGFPT